MRSRRDILHLYPHHLERRLKNDRKARGRSARKSRKVRTIVSERSLTEMTPLKRVRCNICYRFFHNINEHIFELHISSYIVEYDGQITMLERNLGGFFECPRCVDHQDVDPREIEASRPPPVHSGT